MSAGLQILVMLMIMLTTNAVNKSQEERRRPPRYWAMEPVEQKKKDSPRVDTVRTYTTNIEEPCTTCK